MSGDGPLSTGDQDNFTQPTAITSDVGCADPASVILMDKGIMFKSDKGIYLLSRGLDVQYVGAAVEDYNSLTINGAALLEDQNEVRFTTSGSVILSYNYFFDKWSVFTNMPATSCTVWQDKFVWVDTNGVVYQENTDYQDAGSDIPFKITTPWIRIQATQAFQRVYRAILLGEFKSSHLMKVRIAYDYADAYTDEFTFTDDAIGIVLYGDSTPYGDEALYGGEDLTVYQIRSRLARQKCESIKFEFSDVSGSSSGESFVINELALEVGAKQGVYKLQASKSVGA